MERQKNNNITMKVLSVVIAILIWLLVANTNDPVKVRKFSDVPVCVKNEDVLIEQGLAYTITEGNEVSFTVKGKNSIVGNLTSNDFSVVADLSKLSNVNAVPIDITAGKYTDQLEISLGTINTLKIQTEEMLEKDIAVNVEPTGTPAQGYAVVAKNSTPNIVKVTGPSSVIEKIDELRATIDVTGASKEFSKSCVPVLYDESGKTIDNSQIQFDSPSVITSVLVYKTKEVPLTISCTGQPASGYVMTSTLDYDPKTIMIAASDEQLRKIKSVSLGEISIDHLSKNYEDTISLTNDTLPNGVYLAESYDGVKVKATIEPIKTKKITIASSDLTVKNKGKYIVDYDNSSVIVLTMEGASSILKTVKISDLEPWIDLEEADEPIVGHHSLPLHIKSIDGVSVNDKTDVKLTISEP